MRDADRATGANLDAGSPPDIVWTLPPGASVSAIDGPTPRHQPNGPVISYVYTNEVVTARTHHPATARRALDDPGRRQLLVCKVDCVPEEGRFVLTLPARAVAPGPDAPLFAAADARGPVPWTYSASVSPDGSLHLSGAGIGADKVREAWFFPAAWGDVDQNPPQILTQDGDRLEHCALPFGPKAAWLRSRTRVGGATPSR
jgi:DsbC/DsbD-like thiol-disulfide interchange protein